MTVALYARVTMRGQDPQLQLDILRDYCQRRGFVVHDEYVDMGQYIDMEQSANDPSRPELDRLMKDALGRYFQAVVVWKFDCFARSVRHLIKVLEEFKALEIDFLSMHEKVDTTTPKGKTLFTHIKAMSQLEHDLICERLKVGVARAKKRGKVIGRPSISLDLQAIRALKKHNWSNKRIAEKLKVSESTIARRVALMGQKPTEFSAKEQEKLDR